ncbi:MAG: glycosyltransferase [Actinobacteria bacterium]|nr:MAG: glycosyltransferase [Actinomycetota bacterium]
MPRVFRILATAHPSQSSSASERPQASRVTVVIPTYNRAELLAQTLSSVFAQQPAPCEVIVVDDGSTDGTIEYLESVDVSVLRNKRGGWGPARGRNEGFKRTSSDFIAFLDSDDLLLPGTLGRLERALEENPTAPFAFGRCLTALKENGRWRATGLMTVDSEEMDAPLRSLFARNFVPSVGSVARTEAVGKIGGYPENTAFAEDHYFWLRLAQLADPVFVSLLTCVYRVHTGNRHSPTMAAREVEEYLALAREDPRLAPCVPARLGVALCGSFTANLGPGDRGKALASVRKNLLTRRHKGEILRAAYKHWRDRRRWVEEGLRLWDEDDELRAWLAHY